MELFYKAVTLADAKEYSEATKTLQDFITNEANAEYVPGLILLRALTLAHPPTEGKQVPSESALFCKIKTLALSQEAIEKTTRATIKLGEKYREKSGCGVFLIGSIYDLFFDDRKKAEMFYAMSVTRWKNDMGMCALGFSLVTSNVSGADGDEEERKFRMSQAVNYIKEAAAAGNAMAKANLGVIYLSGVGIGAPDPEKAQKLFEESAELGNPMGLNNLVDMHMRRKTLSLEKCKEMLGSIGIAKMNNSRSMNMLGQILESEGDYDGAFMQYSNAAEQDYARALFNVGRFTLEGKGSVEKNFSEGYRILCLSASMGDHLAKNAIRKIRDELKSKPN